ncbi:MULTISPECIES: RNase A-like domain-containing protein [Methylosinus]|uniref:RNase A-like domain-containing protein n=1 Tax=Methylosinus TaxID=425 RepID=UPI001FEF3323|nr:RNase A-like domain-containing protein [Methylosinus sporium]
MSDVGALLVGDSNDARYSVDLLAEEGYGHAIRNHAGKEDVDLIAALESKRIRIGLPFIGVIAYEPAVGSFDSRETANDLVNRVIETNKDRVDSVAEGRRDELTLQRIFGFRTGKEAFLESGTSKPVVRWTFGVRVVLHADPTSDRGYRVRTAFPVDSRSGR